MGCDCGTSIGKLYHGKKEEKALQRMPALGMSEFLKSEKQVLPELGTEQVPRVIKASLAVHSYAQKAS